MLFIPEMTEAEYEEYKLCKEYLWQSWGMPKKDPIAVELVW